MPKYLVLKEKEMHGAFGAVKVTLYSPIFPFISFYILSLNLNNEIYVFHVILGITIKMQYKRTTPTEETFFGNLNKNCIF